MIVCYTILGNIKLEFDLEHFKILKDVVVYSADTLAEDRKFKDVIGCYNNFEESIQRRFNEFSKDKK